MSDETKKCPQCAEMIQMEAQICRFCGAQFEVTRRGYCSTEHDMMDVDENGRCKKCGGEVMDIRLESRMIAEGRQGVAAPAPASTSAAPGEVTEWVIEPIRGEGVNWRFNGVFIDAILINILYMVVGVILAIPLALAQAGNVSDEISAIYGGGLLVLLAVIWFLYFFLFEWLNGATPGKLSSNLKVIRKDGGKIEWWQALIRAFLSIFEDNLIGAIVIWVTPLKQRIADLIAGTLVVNVQKIHKMEFRSDFIAFEFHDYRRVEFARVTEGVVHKFGLIRQMTLNGVSPQSDLVTLKWNAQFQRGEFDRIRREIERRSGMVFPEKIIWWRLIVTAFGVLTLLALLALLLLVLANPNMY